MILIIIVTTVLYFMFIKSIFKDDIDRNLDIVKIYHIVSNNNCYNVLCRYNCIIFNDRSFLKLLKTLHKYDSFKLITDSFVRHPSIDVDIEVI